MKMRTLFLLAICLSSIGCSLSINLPQEKIDQIPESANRVDLFTEDMIDETYANVKMYLFDRGYTIRDENEVSHRFETNLVEVGQRTKLSVTLRVSPIDNGSKIEAIGTWSSDVEESTLEMASQNVSAEDQEFALATWGGTNRSSYAYSQLVLLFDNYPAREIQYVKQ